MLRVGEGEEQRDGNGVGFGGADFFDQGSEVCGIDGKDGLAVACDSFGETKAEGGGDEAWGRGLEPVVEAGAGLAADGEGVFKSAGGDEGDAGSGALKHGVGADGGSVANDGAGDGTDLLKALYDGGAGIVGCGKNLKSGELAVAHGNAISKRAAGVDGDAWAAGIWKGTCRHGLGRGRVER